MWSYVGKRVSLAVIGFFEGAAEGMVELIDTGASLLGYHPDLEGKIAERYTQIKDAYSDAIGIDQDLTHDAAIGRFGGKLAENLPTGKAIGQLGLIGTVINVAQAVAGAKSTVEAVVAMREQGRSWSDIVSDPVMLAQFAGSLAGVAGVGGAAVPQLRSALGSAGLVLTAGQMTALTTARGLRRLRLVHTRPGRRPRTVRMRPTSTTARSSCARSNGACVPARS